MDPQPKSVFSLAEVKRRALAHALDLTGNSITRAARALVIDGVSLHRKLK